MVSQFEVYWVDLNPTIGAEMQKIRPCAIISPKELNEHLDTVIIVPITSAIHGYPYRVRCHIMGRDGEIATDQIRTIDKRRLKNRITILATDEIAALQDVLHQMFCEQFSLSFPSALIHLSSSISLLSSSIIHLLIPRLLSLEEAPAS